MKRGCLVGFGMFLGALALYGYLHARQDEADWDGPLDLVEIAVNEGIKAAVPAAIAGAMARKGGRST